MFTHKDIEMRSIFVVNCIQHDRSLRVNSGELMLEEIEGDKKKDLNKVPFPKVISSFHYRTHNRYNSTDRQMQKVWSCNRCYETKLTSRFLLG